MSPQKRSRLLLASLRGRFSAPLATLTVVTFLATFAPPRAAHASAEFNEPADTPNFSESTNGVRGGVDSAATSTRSTKSRKAPVSAKGSFTRSVDIQLPPGRLGMTPSLALHYDSSSVAESAVGVGWSFGPPMISRSTRKGFPKVLGPDSARAYDDAAAVFTGPGGEMVPATDGPAGTTGTMYAPIRESSPVRYEYLGAASGDRFIEHDPSGKKRYYGADPCLGRTGRITNELGTNSWLLLREEDPHGNSISYRYHNDTEASRSNRRVAQKTPVLARVEWGSNGCVPITSAPFLVATTIEAQAGPVNLLEGNTLLDHRISKIDISVEGVVRWTYTLGYTESTETRKSLLTSVQRMGDAPETTTFSYTAGAPSGPRFAPMGELAPGGTMYTNTSRWQQSLAPFEAARSSAEQAVQAPGFRPGTKFIDVDGNGTTDAIYHAAGLGTLATHVLWEESALQAPSPTGLGTWSTPSTSGTTQADTGLPFFPLNDTLSKGLWTDPGFATSVVQDLTDLDGDGDADAVSLPLSVRVAPGYGVALNPPPAYAETPTPGHKLFRITTNSARNAGGQHPLEQLVTNWPANVDLISTIRAASAETNWISPLKYKSEVDSDVQLPVVDLNADGRSDMVLLKHRESAQRFLNPGGAIAIPHSAFMRLYSGTVERELGEVDELPLEEEIRAFVTDQHLIVLVDEDLLLSETAPSMHVRLPTTSDRLRIPELPEGTPMMMLSAPGGVPATGFPSNPPVPPGWEPLVGPFLPKPVPERAWYLPIVDPWGDVFIPLRDSYAVGGSSTWSNFLLGEYRYVPRVYLTRGDAARTLVSEPNENVSHFERSLQKSLNMGRTQECDLLQNCQYPPHVNFNSFFADVNGDGLPDLISAVPPQRVPTGQVNEDGAAISSLVCPAGHRVELNRGYAFEEAPGETLASQGWAVPDDPTHPLTVTANRDRSCEVTRPRICDAPIGLPFTCASLQWGLSMPTYPTSAMAQTDINGDGRVDILLAYRRNGISQATSQELFLNTGRGYRRVDASTFGIPAGIALSYNVAYPNEVAPSLTGWPRAGLADMARFVDLDNDGLVDIVTGGLCYRGTTSNIHEVPPEICDPARWYHNEGTLPDRMVRIDGSDRAWTTIEYESPKSEIVQLAADGIRPPATMRVVKTITSAAGPVAEPGYDPLPVQRIRMSYDNFVRDLVDNEVLGFEKVTAEFVNEFDGAPRDTVKVTRTFDVQPERLDAGGRILPIRHPLKGALLSSVTESNGWVATELMEYLVEPLGAGVRVRPWRELHGDVSPYSPAAWTGQETVRFDAYGNPTESVTGNWDGAAIAPGDQRRTTGTLYDDRTGHEWIIGLVARQQSLGYSEDIDGNVDPAHVLGETLSTYDAKGSVVTTTRVNIRAPMCDGTDNDETSYSYRASGLLKRTVEAAGPGGSHFRVVDFAYDAKELYVASATTSVGGMSAGVFVPASTTLTASFVTDLRHGKTAQSTDPNGKVTTSIYDSAGRVLTRRGPDNTLLESNVYADSFPLGTTSTITTDVGKTFQRYTQLDADGHVLSVTEGSPAESAWSRKAKTRYDAFGRAVESFLPAFVSGIYGGITPSIEPKDVTTYDGFDRATQVNHADGTTTSAYYEPRRTTETDARGVPTLRGYDAFGELITVTRGVGQAGASTHSFVRDGRGEIIKVTDGDGSERRIERDGGGRIRFVTLPTHPGVSAPRFAMCHDLDDKLVRLESPAGRVVTVVHDELGRTLETTATDANGLTVETRQTYDVGVAGGLGLGRLTSKTDESGTYALAYDAYGRPKTVSFEPSSRAVAGASNVAASYGASFVYTPTGALSTVNFTGLPAAASLSYQRDDRGRIRQIDTTEGAAVTTLAADFLFQADDKITSARYGNGTSAEWTFNPLSERLDRIAYKSSAGAPLAGVSYIYDPTGNPTREDRDKNGGISSQKFHAFDELDRLVTTYAFAPSGNTSATFAFSPGGNLLAAGNEAYSYASPVSSQAVTAVVDPVAGKQRALAYDLDGYLASDQETRADGSSSSRTLAFDPTGCMRSISRDDLAAGGTPSSASSEYTCGLDGRVVARDTLKADGSHARRIDFAGLAEIRPDEGVFMLRVPVSGSVSVEDARSLSTGARVTALSGYLVNDARGSVLATTGFDPGATAVTTEVEYDAWGKKLAGYSSLASPRHGFAGAEPDEAAGTYSFGARTYDPTLRRWVSPDPLLASVPALDEALGDNLNLYSYAGNNPVRRIDLTGFEGESFTERMNGATTFVKGLVQGGAEATVPGGMVAAAVTPNPAGENAAAFAKGRAAGQIIGGVVAMVSGGQSLVGAAELEVGSGGTATAAVAVTGAVAAAQIANGMAAVSAGIKGSQTTAATGAPPPQGTAGGIKGECTSPGKTSGGGKNGQHANQDKRAAAKERYDGARKQYEKLNSVRNKTPADKAARDSAKKAMEKARKDKDFTGENHSQRGKR